MSCSPSTRLFKAIRLSYSSSRTGGIEAVAPSSVSEEAPRNARQPNAEPGLRSPSLQGDRAKDLIPRPHAEEAPAPRVIAVLMKALKPRPLFENRDDRAGEALKILLADGKGRRQIDNIAQWPHEDAGFDKPAPQRAEIIDAIEFDDADRAFHPHVAHTRQLAGRFERAVEHFGNGRDLLKARFA